MPLEIGQLIQERYQIEEILGQGGFGCVYRATDQRLERTVVLKESLVATELAARQFDNEAKMLARLGHHPHLTAIYDFFSLPVRLVSGPGYYLVMEYIAGQNLADLLEQNNGPFPIAQALDWIDQVLEALVFLHSRTPPVIHRDIKPDNIKIHPERGAVLVDFGIAKVYDPGQGTLTALRAYTPGYAPYEQCVQGRTDQRTDIYSVGATLYALLTGAKPEDSTERVEEDKLKTPRTLNPAVDPALDAMVMKATALFARQRYQTVAELRVDLQDCREKKPVLAVRPTIIPVVKEEPALRDSSSDAQRIDTPLVGVILSSVNELRITLAPGVEMTFMRVPAGKFIMGCNTGAADEKPEHVVELAEYWMGKYPVTQAQYQCYIQANPHYRLPNASAEKARLYNWDTNERRPPKGKADHPVVLVSWEDAQAFCQWAVKQTGHAIRLPTEAEWEKAARGTDKRFYPWGVEPPDAQQCNFDGIVGGTTPAGLSSPLGDSPNGCADMAGNVWEWVVDWYGEAYYKTYTWDNSPANPTGPKKGMYRVLRGGSWHDPSTCVRAAYRSNYAAENRYDNIGFRCALSPGK